MRKLQFRPVPVSSVVHRLRAETKILCLVTISLAVALDPGWVVIGYGWAALVVLFLLARLPCSVLAPPPSLLLSILGFSGLFSLIAGGDPTVGGIGLGAVLDLARLVALGFLLVGLAAVLAWTTSLTEVGLALGRLVRPSRRLGVPADEIATAVALTVRALPLVREELGVVLDARATRPAATVGKKRRRALTLPFTELVDLGTTVVVGAHRRAAELAQSMVVRGSITAPVPDSAPVRLADVIAGGIAVALATAFIVFA